MRLVNNDPRSGKSPTDIPLTGSRRRIEASLNTTQIDFGRVCFGKWKEDSVQVTFIGDVNDQLVGIPAVLGAPQRFSVTSFEGWRGARPAIASASFLSVARAESRALLAESGQADLSFGLDPPSLARLRQSPTVNIVAVTIPRTIILKLNAGHPALRDRRVREAIAANAAGPKKR